VTPYSGAGEPDGDHLTQQQMPQPEASADSTGDHDPGVCWRCGQPFASTNEDALRHCAELARDAA